MKFSILATPLFLASLAYAASAEFVVKESVPEPTQWIKRGPAPSDHVLTLHFGLRQRAVSDLETQLLDVSDPTSPNYGKWLSQSQVDSLLQPAEESAQTVKRWLSEHLGQDATLQKRSTSGDWIAAQMTVQQAEKMLGNTAFNVYENKQTGEQIVRTTEYSVPRDVSEHLDLVSPTTYFRQIRALNSQVKGLKFTPLDEPAMQSPTMQRISANKQSSMNKDIAAGQPSSCNATAVSTQCLRDYYQTSDYNVKSPNSQIIGISGFLEQYATYDDLAKYLQKQRPDAAKANYKFTTVDIAGSTNDQNDAGVEANLDVQTVAGIGFPIPSTFYSTAGSPPFKTDKNTPTNTNEPYSTEFGYLLGLSDEELPSILSTSYGDDEQTVPLSYQRRVCMEAAALGARGVTVFFASGDYGVGADGTCVSNDGKNKRMFLPSFPPSCPYVTVVGATDNFAPEKAVGPSFYGGGGFSNDWPMPKYQKKTVKAYVKGLDGKYKGLYNPKGRAYPDLSAQGQDFLITLNGTVGRVSGTSASTPLTAAIFGLVNDKRISEGKPTLGFLNPALYSGAGEAGLHDITVGSNKGCETDGFPATKGWDAATGWGTPRFHKLAKALG